MVENKRARIVQRALEDAGLDCQVKELPDSTRTVKDAARAVGCQPAQIAKSIVFMAAQSERPVLVVASGTNRISEALIEQELGEAVVQASPKFVRQTTGFAIGGVPPCGHVGEVILFIDQDLFSFDSIWLAAGTPNAVFVMSPNDLVSLTGGKVIAVVKKLNPEDSAS